MVNSTSAPPTDTTQARRPRYRWRVVDIVVGAVLGVAVGVIFWAWGLAWNGVSAPFTALLPGVQAFAAAVWLVGGVLGGFVIRKPGAAIYVEVVAAVVSALIGTQWGFSTIVSGFMQGLGAEIIVAVFLYRVWRLPIAWLAGAGAGLFMAFNDLVVYAAEGSATYKIIYTLSGVLGGAVIAGTVGWLLTRALARSGALSRFASGREQSSLV